MFIFCVDIWPLYNVAYEQPFVRYQQMALLSLDLGGGSTLSWSTIPQYNRLMGETLRSSVLKVFIFLVNCSSRVLVRFGWLFVEALKSSIDWLNSRLIDRSIDWLIDWLIRYIQVHRFFICLRLLNSVRSVWCSFLTLLIRGCTEIISFLHRRRKSTLMATGYQIVSTSRLMCHWRRRSRSSAWLFASFSISFYRYFFFCATVLPLKKLIDILYVFR